MANPDDLLPGAVLQGRYEIVRKVGGGGMGVVYEAIDTNLSRRRVAIKAMKQPSGAGQAGLDMYQAVRLFRQEAAILSRLNHPNLPHVYDTFEERGVYYLVMDFIAGETLSQKLRRTGHPLSTEEVVSYAIQLCDILTYLHSQHPQVIFRDLKPANVIVDPSGRVYLVDFGIARHFKPLNSSDTILIGTSGYSDPELSQLKQTSPRSDLYSLGATLHHCLTGQTPNYAHQAYRFPQVRYYNARVPAELDQLILKLVEPQSRRRPDSALRVRQQLIASLRSIRNTATTGTIIDPNAPTVFTDHNAPTQSAPVFAPLIASLQNASPHLASASNGIATLLATLALGMKILLIWLWQALVWFVSILFIGVQFIIKTLLSPITRQRVGDLWRQARQESRKLVHRSQHVVSTWSWSEWYSPIWQPRFLGLLSVLLTPLIVASVYLFHTFHNSYYAVNLCLSLLLLFIILPAYRAMNQGEAVPRTILVGTGIAALVSLAALLLAPFIGVPASQAFLAPNSFSSPPTIALLVTWLLLVLALLSFCSGFVITLSQAYVQPASWRGWIDRLTLFALTASWTLLQYFSGSAEHLPLFSSYPLSTAIGLNTNIDGITAITVNQLLCLPLALIALILLLRPKSKVTVGDRRLLFLAMLPYLLLQWTDGPAELLHLFPTMQLSSATALNVILVLALVILLFILQRPELDRLDLLDRGALLLVILASALLQNFLSGSPVMQTSLLAAQLPAFTLSFILPAVLLVAALLLIVRLGRMVGVFDRGIISIMAFACILLEFASGQQELRNLGQTSANGDPAQSIELAYLHQALAWILLLLLIVSIFLAAGCALLPALQQNNQQQNDRVAGLLRWIDRTTLIASGLAALLLLFTYMWQGQMLPYFQQPTPLFNALSQGSLLYLPGLLCLILAFFLLCSVLIQLFRFSKPLERKDRVIVLLSLLVCLLLLVASQDVLRLPLLAANIQHLTGGWPGLLSPKSFSILGVLAAALISLCWTIRPFKRVDRVVLGAVFLIAAAFALFQFGHTQLFIALLLLIVGLVTALHIERVRLGTKII